MRRNRQDENGTKITCRTCERRLLKRQSANPCDDDQRDATKFVAQIYPLVNTVVKSQIKRICANNFYLCNMDNHYVVFLLITTAVSLEPLACSDTWEASPRPYPQEQDNNPFATPDKILAVMGVVGDSSGSS